MILITILLISMAQAPLNAKESSNVGILPFKVHSMKPLPHLGIDIQKMFIKSMEEKGITSISPAIINKQPESRLPVPTILELMRLGKRIRAKWILKGSLTVIGQKISMDLQLIDTSGLEPPYSLFLTAESIDRLEDIVKDAVKTLYNRIAGVVQVEAVRVEGNKRVEAEAIKSVIQSKKGEEYNLDKINKDLRAIYQMGYFTDVQVETEDGAEGKILIFKVKEKPSIASINFVGNKHISDKDLKEECGIKEYSILNLNEVKQSINRLKDLYRQKGYYQINIKEKIEELPRNEVSLTYEIEEGEKIYISEIRFEGNKYFKDDKLKDLMETSEKGFFSWITRAGLLDRKKLEFDLQKITSFYHNHGFIKAKTGEPRITYEKGKGLIITIPIIEGNQYSVKKVSIEGEKKDDLIAGKDWLMKLIRINKEKYFNREVIRDDILALRNFYGDEGYAYVEISPLIKEDDKKHTVDITYKISKGMKVKFERINITGNTYTRDKVIRRELKVTEGGYFSGEKLKKSIQNLHRLGFFEDIEVKRHKGSRDDLMVLDINVKERPTGSFTIGAGYSSFENAIGMFQIAQNNFMGYGQKLAASGRFGARTVMFDIRFTEPWLMDRPISAGIDLYKWKTDYYEYTKDSLGGALRFKFPIGIDEEFTRVRVRYMYDDADISDIEDTASLAIKEMEGRNVTSSLTLGIERNTKDRPWDTTKGSFNSLSFEYAGGVFGGDVYFNKLLAKTAWYFPLPFKTVFLAQGRWGYVKQRSGGKLPIYQKFRIGGINTVRGFDYASISPEDPATGDKIGGERMMVYNLEYRFPVLKEQGIKGLVFFDAGTVTTEDQGFDFGELRESVGTGIRWYSPIGPLRLEYGWKLDRRADETSGEWAFSVGGVF